MPASQISTLPETLQLEWFKTRQFLSELVKEQLNKCHGRIRFCIGIAILRTYKSVKERVNSIYFAWELEGVYFDRS